MAHQAHALPWKTLAANLVYKKIYRPNTMDQSEEMIIPLDKESQAKELAYFGRGLAKQIQEFGASERAKYKPQAYYVTRATEWTNSAFPNDEVATEASAVETRKQHKKEKLNSKPEARMVYSDELKDRYWGSQHDERPLNFSLSLWRTDSQDIECWLDRPSCGNTDFGETIKVLMMEASAAAPAVSAIDPLGRGHETKRENMETLLLMANHPRVSVHSFRNMHHGHHFGVSRVAEEAVKAYVFLNVLVVMKENGSKLFDTLVDADGNTDKDLRQNYMALRQYTRLLSSIAGSYDGDAQCIVHQDFFFSKPWSAEAREVFWKTGTQKPTNDVLADMEELKEYLKGVWRIMVTYDIILREEGQDPDWEDEFRSAMIHIYGAYFEYDKCRNIP
ncbi:hypothetical protein PVAG01_01247 [Phlyctema vagabunda]|uniref:Uncharacterized protein n=1 Tax=Phlyctema vagabunda TaxID=108571 RepID=A0ABR4PWK1_9HELO